jgi:integrating conjugative element protein (TIGR03749 family)
MKLARCAGALLAALIPLAAPAVETLHWKRLPLPVNLYVGEERVIFTERDIRVGVPANLKDRLRAQSAGGAIYLRASAAIPAARLQLQDTGSGALVLLDVTAIEPGGEPPLEPLRIVADAPRQAAAQKTAAGKLPAATEPAPIPVPILLTRFAAQSLYAPLRAIEPVAGIRRAPMRDGLDLSALLPSLPVDCRALAAWKLEGSFVTAILIRNASRRTLQLDPRLPQGEFATATFQHPFLGPRGEATDTTVLYLVTRGRRLAESLLPASARIEPAEPGGRPVEK